MYDHGISREGDVLDLGVEERVVSKSGAWFNYGEIRLGQGRENSKKFLAENAKLFDEIRNKILEKRVPKVSTGDGGDGE
jgi:recombination protein RecA